jgi:hypothetical protein
MTIMTDKKKHIQSWEDREYFIAFPNAPHDYAVDESAYRKEQLSCLFGEII